MSPKHSVLIVAFFSWYIISQEEKPIIIVIGTRPECIKMAPIYHALTERGLRVILCSTDQHTTLLEPLFTLFAMQPDIRLHIMRPDQTLSYITTTVLTQLEEIFTDLDPSLVLVQGDTTSAMAAALAAFYLKIPVGHVEAGLRTYNRYAPFPEEMNRRIISSIASYHFAPTALAAERLSAEGIAQDTIFITGNSVVDALRITLAKIMDGQIPIWHELTTIISAAKRDKKYIVTFTMHRRESFDYGIDEVLSGIREAVALFPSLFIIFPVHPNPHVIEHVYKHGLHELSSIRLMPPLSYQDMIYLMHESDFVITDSGGLQEEAVSLGKQVLILREESERIEGIQAGLATLVGFDKYALLHALQYAITIARTPRKHCAVYGDGFTADRISSLIQTFL